MGLFRHQTRPEWGTAQLLAEENGKRTFIFSDGRQRSFPESHWHLLVATGEGEPAATPPRPPEATDMRALVEYARFMDDSESNAEPRYDASKPGSSGKVGFAQMRHVLRGWLVGARARVAPALSQAVELIEHARADERTAPFEEAKQAEALALGYWLLGRRDEAGAMFLSSALASKAHFDDHPDDRRDAAGDLLLRFCAAGAPQRGLDAVHAVEVPRPRAHPEDSKARRQNQHWDEYGRTMESLAAELARNAPEHTIRDQALEYVGRRIRKDIEETSYLFVEVPRHIVIAKAFVGDPMDVDPENAIAALYLTVPSVRRPPLIASLL